MIKNYNNRTMKTLKFTVMILLLFTGFTKTYAQDDNSSGHKVTISIPEVALLDLEGSKCITLAPKAPTEAGEGFDFSQAVDNNAWINYSSVVGRHKTRSVTVEITRGYVPEGLILLATAANDAGNGKGKMGNPSGQIKLSNNPQKIIYNVGSCYTGNGTNNGHNLSYKLDIESDADYAKLTNTEADLTITYTLTDDY